MIPHALISIEIGKFPGANLGTEIRTPGAVAGSGNASFLAGTELMMS